MSAWVGGRVLRTSAVKKEQAREYVEPKRLRVGDTPSRVELFRQETRPREQQPHRAEELPIDMQEALQRVLKNWPQ
jgi:hypothetical protein